MTKTESLRAATKTIAIESCQEWLQCEMSEGVRAAIPNTNNLIMVGPQEWIAENVLAVEAMVGREPAHIPQTADEVIAFIGNHYDSMEQRDDDTETRFQLSVHDLLSAFRWWFDTDLAATTQASTAQAERPLLPSGWKVTQQPGVIVIRKEGIGGIALGPRYASDGNIAASIFEEFLKDLLAEAFATSSTDAQAAAEVRDAALVNVWNDALTEVRVQVKAMQDAAYTFGEYSKEAVTTALDGVLDAIDELRSAGDAGGQHG